MTALVRKNRKGILLGLAPVFLLAVASLFALSACDAGDAPDPPTGPDATYDPNFDEGRSGVTVQVSPSSVTVPDPVTGESGEVTVFATYRTPEGNRQSGIQMNFTADPYNPAVSFNPPAAFTNEKGLASTTAYLSKSIPEGSVTIVAYTSPASGGPSARGQDTIFVTQTGVAGLADLQITTLSLDEGTEGVSYSQSLTATGGLPPYMWSIFSGLLPSGLNLSSTGQISGTPDPGTAGSHPITFRVTDNNASPDIDTRDYTIVIAAP